MVLSPDKCFFMLLGIKFKRISYLTRLLLESKDEKVLGITFDNKLDFSMHLTSVTKRANINANILTVLHKYITLEQKRFLTSSFIKSQFNYYL